MQHLVTSKTVDIDSIKMNYNTSFDTFRANIGLSIK